MKKENLNYWDSAWPAIGFRLFTIFHSQTAKERNCLNKWQINSYGSFFYYFIFYAPEIEDRGAYCFCPVCHSVVLSFCNSVILSFCPPLWNFNLANNFWTVSSRALIFHRNIPCDKTFLLVPLLLTLWPWPWSLTHFLKT